MTEAQWEEIAALEQNRRRPTIFGWLRFIACLAICLKFWVDCQRNQRLGRAEMYAQMARAQGTTGNPILREWYDHKRREFEAAARRPWLPDPTSSSRPPLGWTPPPAGPAAP